MLKKARLLLLLILLLVIALNVLLSQIRISSWDRSIWVVIYPLNADDRQDTQKYIDTLTLADFRDIAAFFSREGARYRLALEQPVEIKLSSPISVQPPEPPDNPSILSSVIWSLRMRYWSWRYDNWQGPSPDVRIYMRFFSPENRQSLRHSLGLQKGLIGLVNAYADSEQQGQNNLIAAHELLHTLGASDKYDPATNWPVWPGGYADPVKAPLLPQEKAEIMGGRVQISPAIAVIPPSLEHAVIGAETAIEINWLSVEAARQQ